MIKQKFYFKTMEVIRVLVFLIFILQLSCTKQSGESNSSQTPSVTPLPKLTYLMRINNTVATFYRCSLGAEGIVCSGKAELLPTMSSFALFKKAKDWPWIQLKDLADGCFENLPSGDLTLVDSVTPDDDCNLEGRMFSGETTQGLPSSTWTMPGKSNPATYFSATFPFFEKRTFQVVNVKSPGKACSAKVISRISTSPYAFSETASYSINEGYLTFPTLFSLGAKQVTRNITSASRSSDFIFGYQPAIDAQPLIDAALTDDNIRAYMSPHLGDFLVLKISNGSRTFYCKAADAIEGDIIVPKEVMANFSGQTGFTISRYKIASKDLSDNVEIMFFITVGMYTNGTDAYGQSGGTVSVYIGD